MPRPTHESLYGISIGDKVWLNVGTDIYRGEVIALETPNLALVRRLEQPNWQLWFHIASVDRGKAFLHPTRAQAERAVAYRTLGYASGLLVKPERALWYYFLVHATAQIRRRGRRG